MLGTVADSLGLRQGSRRKAGNAQARITLAITWPQRARKIDRQHSGAAQVCAIVSLPPISSQGRPSLRPPTP